MPIAGERPWLPSFVDIDVDHPSRATIDGRRPAFDARRVGPDAGSAATPGFDRFVDVDIDIGAGGGVGAGIGVESDRRHAHSRRPGRPPISTPLRDARAEFVSLDAI
ncbi:MULTISPECIES: hypothetical protein [Burkholderia]|uniref:hypothetical protein n=1 Tax=Burkholderia TaxID=32008 RepID=UPI00126A081A|nr:MULTISPECIES: hypothetical protein [Burkholderia]